MNLGSIPAASTATIKVPFVPEILVLKTAVLTNVTSLKVNIFGVGITVDLLNTGIAALDAMGQVAEDTTAYVIPLANGKFLNKDCEITIANAAAGATVEVYGFGTRIGTHLIKHMSESYVANNVITKNKFLFLSFPAMAAADVATVEHNVSDEDGDVVGTFNEQMDRNDLLSISGAFQGRTGYHFNNFNQLYKKVDIRVSADSTIYVSSIIASDGSNNL